MEKAPENDKESSHSAHANGMNEQTSCFSFVFLEISFIIFHIKTKLLSLSFFQQLFET